MWPLRWNCFAVFQFATILFTFCWLSELILSGSSCFGKAVEGVCEGFLGESNPLRVMRCDSGESVLERGRVLVGEPEDLVGQGLYKKAERGAEALYSSSSSRFGICYGFLSWEVEGPAGQLEWDSRRCFLERWEPPSKGVFIRHKDQLLKLGLYFPFFLYQGV